MRCDGGAGLRAKKAPAGPGLGGAVLIALIGPRWFGWFAAAAVAGAP